MERYEMYYNINFKEFFDILRREPETFLLRKDIVLLQEFLMWYPWNKKIDKKIYYIFGYRNFDDYVLAFFKEKDLLKNMNHNTVAWSEWIVSVCSNQNEAWNLFFEILDQFVEDVENGLLPDEAYLMPVCERKQKNIGRYVWPDDMNETTMEE